MRPGLEKQVSAFNMGQSRQEGFNVYTSSQYCRETGDTRCILSLTGWGMSSCTEWWGAASTRYKSWYRYSIHREFNKIKNAFTQAEPFQEWSNEHIFSRLFEITHAELPEALVHQVKVVGVKSRNEIEGLSTALAWNDAPSHAIKDVPNLVVRVLCTNFGLWTDNEVD